MAVSRRRGYEKVASIFGNIQERTRAVMFGTMAGGENLRPRGQIKIWHRCMVEDLREFRASEGSMGLAPLVVRVETALWSTAEKKAGKRHRGVLEAA